MRVFTLNIFSLKMFSCLFYSVPRSISNLETSERKRVKSRLKKLILRRPPIQALQEKGLIKGELCKAGEHAEEPYTVMCNSLNILFI